MVLEDVFVPALFTLFSPDAGLADSVAAQEDCDQDSEHDEDDHGDNAG